MTFSRLLISLFSRSIMLLVLNAIGYFELETIGIFVAVFHATTVGFYFALDAAKKFNLLTALSEEQPVKVRRNGKVMEIPRHDVVAVYYTHLKVLQNYGRNETFSRTSS